MRNMSNEALEASPAVTVSNASSLNISPLRSSTDDSPHKEPKRYVEVDFRELADGTLVEMIEDPEDATKTLLAICKNGQVRYSEKLECGNQVFVPIPKNTEIIRNVQFANGFEDYESLQLLLGEIMLILADILQLSNEQLLLLSFLSSAPGSSKNSPSLHISRLSAFLVLGRRRHCGFSICYVTEVC